MTIKYFFQIIEQTNEVYENIISYLLNSIYYILYNRKYIEFFENFKIKDKKQFWITSPNLGIFFLVLTHFLTGKIRLCYYTVSSIVLMTSPF